MLISGKRRPRCQVYRTITALSCHQNQHNSTKEHLWCWRWENNNLESWIGSTLEYKKMLWNEAAKTYQSNKLPPSCFASQYNICIPVAIQANKLPVLWGSKEAMPLLSHSSLGEFFQTCAWPSGQQPLSGSSGTASTTLQKHHYHTPFDAEIRQKHCRDFKRTNTSLISSVCESLQKFLWVWLWQGVWRGTRILRFCLFGRRRLFMYLGERNWCRNWAERDVDAALYLLMSESSLWRMLCHIFLRVLWCFHFPQMVPYCVTLIYIMQRFCYYSQLLN